MPAIAGTEVCSQLFGEDLSPKTSCCCLLVRHRAQVVYGSMALFAPHAHFESLYHPGMQHLCTLRHRFTDHKTKTRERSTSEASISPLECVWVTYAIFKSKPL